jgi:cytidine deaminase
LADLFVNAKSSERAASSIRRFIEILFGYPFHSPTRDETGMFYAKSAALRSADLSRQVGAAISTPDGDLISIGCNDVPKAGGGLYWCDDHEDYRDFRRGRDSSVEFKEDIIRELLHHLAEAGWLDKDRASKKSKAMMDEILYGVQVNPLKGSQIMNIIEYGRSVHAEMAALSDAAMRGNSVRGANLHVTTFPCHLCARHIVAAGIKRVVYIEPYPKSMAPHLYEDSIVVDPAEPVEGRVVFEPFVGISPRRYVDLFEVKGKRKDKRGHTTPQTCIYTC